MSEYLYLLRNEEGTAFKIGVSRDPRRRSVGLPQTIDFTTSLQVAMKGGRAYKVERLLHYWFRDHAQAMPRGDGHTEWFSMEAWPDVLAFLADARERLGIGEPMTIPVPVPAAPVAGDPTSTTKKGLSRAECIARRDARREAELQTKRAITEAYRKKVIAAVAQAAEQDDITWQILAPNRLLISTTDQRFEVVEELLNALSFFKVADQYDTHRRRVTHYGVRAIKTWSGLAFPGEPGLCHRYEATLGASIDDECWHFAPEVAQLHELLAPYVVRPGTEEAQEVIAEFERFAREFESLKRDHAQEWQDGSRGVW